MRLLSPAQYTRTLRRSALLAAALAVVCCSSARAQFTSPAERESQATTGDVVAVNFEGNQELSDAELATIVATKATGGISALLYYKTYGILKPFGGAPYQKRDNGTLSRDTSALNLYYRDHGFLSALSTYRVSQNPDDLKAYSDYARRELQMKSPAQKKDATPPDIRETITFHIHEGPAYTISHVTLSGLEGLASEFQPELTEHVTIRSGQRWSRAAAAKEIERLTGIMIEKGYPNFRYDTVVVEHREGRTDVNVILYFTPGHRYRYGTVNIVYDTNAAERSHVAMNIILAQLMMHQGDWYKLSEVQRSEANLTKLGTFELARVSLDTNYFRTVPDAPRDSAEVPLEVLLRMRLRAEVPINIYAGSTGSQGLVIGGGAGFTDRNLFQSADNLNFQVSLQPLPPTQQRQNISLEYLLPYIGLGRIPLISGLGYSRDIQYGVPDTSVHTYDITNYSAHLGSNFVLSSLDNKTSLSPDLLAEYIYGNGTVAQSLLPQQQINLIPSISYQDDRANDPMNPTGGDILSATLEAGLPFSYSGHQSSAYLKLVPQVKEYLDLSTNGAAVVALRLRFGASWLYLTADRPPSFNRRFFGGGAASNRGWPEQTLLVSKDSNAPANLGGFNDLEGNIEFRYAPFQYPQEFTTWQKFSGSIRLVAFYDVGNVWDDVVWSQPSTLNFSMLAQTIGLGLRYNTFFGALRADWGLKLWDPNGQFSSSTTAITPASRGAWLFSHSPLVAVGSTFNWHFGIGQAF